MKTPPLLAPAKLPCLAGLMALAFCFVPGTDLRAQARYTAQPNASSIKIDGTSTLHDWEMEGTLIGGFIEFGPGVQLDPGQNRKPGP